MIYINDDVVMVYILSHVISRSFPTLALQLMITGSFYVTKVLSSYRSTIGDKIVETLYFNRVTSENKRIRTPPLSPPFKVGVFVVFYR